MQKEFGFKVPKEGTHEYLIEWLLAAGWKLSAWNEWDDPLSFDTVSMFEAVRRQRERTSP